MVMMWHSRPGLCADFVFVCVLSALLGCASSRPAVAPAPPATPQPMQAPFVELILFGYWQGEPFTSEWVETRAIPQRSGLRFGWRMKLKEPHGKYAQLIERLTAPQPPNTWGPLEKRRLVSADRVVATVPNTLKVRDGWVHRANWLVSDGDPLGEYEMEVQVNGRLAARLFFTVVPYTGPPLPPPEPEEEMEDELPEDLPAP
jgi:hypothetical protein